MSFNLDELIVKQRELQEYLNWCMGDNTHEIVKNNSLALLVEVTEILNEVDWKQWTPKKGPIDREKLLYEIVDALALLGNIIDGAGFTSSELRQAYLNKLEIYYAKTKRPNKHPSNPGRSCGSCLTKE